MFSDNRFQCLQVLDLLKNSLPSSLNILNKNRQPTWLQFWVYCTNTANMFQFYCLLYSRCRILFFGCGRNLPNSRDRRSLANPGAKMWWIYGNLWWTRNLMIPLSLAQSLRGGMLRDPQKYVRSNSQCTGPLQNRTWPRYQSKKGCYHLGACMPLLL